MVTNKKDEDWFELFLKVKIDVYREIEQSWFADCPLEGAIENILKGCDSFESVSRDLFLNTLHMLESYF